MEIGRTFIRAGAFALGLTLAATGALAGNGDPGAPQGPAGADCRTCQPQGPADPHRGPEPDRRPGMAPSAAPPHRFDPAPPAPQSGQAAAALLILLANP